MDFTKYVSLLQNESLFFVRADKLKDPFEGSFPFNNARNRKRLNKKIPKKILESLPYVYREQRKYTYLNCWHMSEYESAAMWSIYLKSNAGIAICSTFEKLKKEFEKREKPILVGLVNYIDYYADWIPVSNTYYPFMHKRKSYEHEKEVRAVLQDLPVNLKGEVDYSLQNQNKIGVSIQVNLNNLIQKIVISPSSPAWFYDLVKATTEKYGFDFYMEGSDLYSEPFF